MVDGWVRCPKPIANSPPCSAPSPSGFGATAHVQRAVAPKFQEGQPTGIVAQPTPGMQPEAPPGPALPLGPPGARLPDAPPGPAVPSGPPGMLPVAPPGPAAPPGPPGMTPLAPPGPASPPGPPGIAPAAPPGPAVPRLAHGVPSGFTHGGGTGSAIATGVNASAAAVATPAKIADVSFECLMPIRLPAEPRRINPVQAKILANRVGVSFINATIGVHGQPGTAAWPRSLSMAPTSARTPVSLSTISAVFSALAVISDSM